MVWCIVYGRGSTLATCASCSFLASFACHERVPSWHFVQGLKRSEDCIGMLHFARRGQLCGFHDRDTH